MTRKFSARCGLMLCGALVVAVLFEGTSLPALARGSDMAPTATTEPGTQTPGLGASASQEAHTPMPSGSSVPTQAGEGASSMTIIEPTDTSKDAQPTAAASTDDGSTPSAAPSTSPSFEAQGLIDANATPTPRSSPTPPADTSPSPSASDEGEGDDKATPTPSPTPTPTPTPSATMAIDTSVPSLANTVKIPKNLSTAQRGSLVEWSKANGMWKVGQTVTVMDPYTGTTFQAYRIGGSNHADYVPKTKKDTAIAYALYGKHWSWTRKSMLVQLDGRWIAASTNGMPHGQWSKLDNDMNGMLCMHFLYSRTHIHNAQCPQHQKCVLAAAQRVGRVPEAGEEIVPLPEGELVDWLEIDQRWPVGAVATVQNPLTGATAEIRRVGGDTNALFVPDAPDGEAALAAAIGDEPTPLLVQIGDAWVAASLGGDDEEDQYVAQVGDGLSLAPMRQAMPAAPEAEPRALYFLNSKNAYDQPVNYVQQMLVFEAAGQAISLSQQGELVEWAEVDAAWAYGEPTLVQDWQTGTVFRIVRVPGQGHAEYRFDTLRDQAAFQSLLGGSYGLSLRPLMVYIGERWVAASTMCMPHEQPGLTDGALCMHFLNSTLHATNEPEPAHQQCAMIASGAWMTEDGDQSEGTPEGDAGLAQGLEGEDAVEAGAIDGAGDAPDALY